MRNPKQQRPDIRVSTSRRNLLPDLIRPNRAGSGPATYGQSKLSDLVEKAGGFESRRTDAGHLQIRVIPNAKAKSPKAKQFKPA